MTKTVLRTEAAGRTVAALDRRARRRYESAVAELGGRGCLAGGYRMTATGGRDHSLCCRYFYRQWRLHLAFPEQDTVVVVAIGEHTADVNAHVELARAVPGLAKTGRRRAAKRPCCDSPEEPPLMSEELRQMLGLLRRRS